ncbi:hypothetical protein PENTCL1PPCAC_12235 [Pristionchus entomophagus]|uniref:Protein kinase domain-containing protein n=1 Tax=Pristionchus entomophagus TaxID=358040 RepID=A0AAV5TCB8_9BILA|nr:hypothetical protein PENTCL1PPCAC_12235 [Pristionchus entomophagus]
MGAQNISTESRTTLDGLTFILETTTEKNVLPSNSTISQRLTVQNESKSILSSYDLPVEKGRFNIRGIVEESLFFYTSSAGLYNLYKANLDSESKLALKPLSPEKKLETTRVTILNSPHYLLKKEKDIYDLYTFDGDHILSNIRNCTDNNLHTEIVIAKELFFFVPFNTDFRSGNVTVILYKEEIEATELFVPQGSSCVYTFTCADDITTNAASQVFLKVDLIKRETWTLKPKCPIIDIQAIEMVYEDETGTRIVYRKTNKETASISHMQWEKNAEYFSFKHAEPYKVENDFDDIKYLGDGGYSVVLKGRSLKNFYTYAIKIIELSQAYSYKVAIEEVRGMERFKYPGIVCVYDWFVCNVEEDFVSEIKSKYDSMNSVHLQQQHQKVTPSELNSTSSWKQCLIVQIEICSSSLSNWLYLNRLNGAQLLVFMKQLASALELIHKKGVIHADINTANIFVIGKEGFEEVKIGDFGLCRSATTTEGSPDDKSNRELLNMFKSPQRKENSGIRSSPDDIHSLGVVFIHMYHSMHSNDKKGGIARPTAEIVNELREGRIPHELNEMDKMRELVQKMIALEPKDRPTADTVRRELEQFQYSSRDSTIPTREQQTFRSVVKIMIRPVPVTIIAVVSVAVVVWKILKRN